MKDEKIYKGVKLKSSLIEKIEEVEGKNFTVKLENALDDYFNTAITREMKLADLDTKIKDKQKEFDETRIEMDEIISRMSKITRSYLNKSYW